MSSPPSVAHGRPWTPPDTDSEYFIDPFATDATSSDGLDDVDNLTDSWPDHSLVSPRTAHRPKPVASATEPYYSVKSHKKNDATAHAHNERLEYLPDGPEFAASPVKNGDARPHLDVRRYPTAPALYSPMEDQYSNNTHVQGRSSHPVVDPHTPVKGLRTPDPHTRSHHAIPQYPYTPDSARTTRTFPIPAPLSPLPPMPWEARKQSSPMQSALSSCISHLENLIDTRQPNDEQMEYLVTKFEEMALFLSAPEAQSRQSDDHLFSELDIPSGLGISGAPRADEEQKADELRIGVGYIQEVGRYIESVKSNARDWKMRIDEAKQLNSIQLDIIEDLRRELRDNNSPAPIEKETEVEKEIPVEPTKTKPREVRIYTTQRTGFWAALGGALDSIGDQLLEW